MKKTIISLALTFSLISANYAFADNFTDVKESSYQHAIDVVTSFGIINGDSEGYFFPSAEITRAEFAEIIYNILNKNYNRTDASSESQNEFISNLGDSAVNTSYYFTDVPDYHSAYDAINYVAASGFMGGIGDGKFAPDRNIKLEEALKTILCSFRLVLPQNIQNDYPNQVIAEAERMGLLDGVASKKGDFIKKEEIAQIIYNSFDEKILNSEYIAPGGQKYYHNDNTVLSSVLDIDYVRDTVVMNDITSFTGSSELGKNQIKIAGDIINFTDEQADIRDTLGMKIKAYYRKDSYEDKQLLYYEVEKQNDVLTIKSEDVEDFNDGVLKYSNKNSKKTIKIPDGTPVIYNGKAVSTYNKSNFVFQSGTVKIIKNNSSCDLVIIEDYSVVFTAGVDKKNRIIYNRLITDKFPSKWEIDKDDAISVYDASGNAASLDSVMQGNVLNVINNNGYVKILISDTTVSGNVAYFDDDKQSVAIGKTEYEILNTLKNFYEYSDPKGNDEVTLYLDCFGRVAWIDYANEELRDCAYLIKTYMAENGDDVFYRMYLPTGKFADFKASKNVIYLDENEKSTKLVNTQRCSTLQNMNMFVYYKLDDDGLIRQIAKPIIKEGQKDTGRLIASITSDETQSYTYRTNNYSFGGIAFVDAQTKVMLVPDDINDYGKYSIQTRSVWTNSGKYVIDAYTTDPTSKLAEIVVYHYADKSSISTERLAGFVKSIVRAVDEDNNLIDSAVIRYKNEDVVVTSEVDSNGLSAFNNVKNPNGEGSFDIKKGDLVVYETDFNNKLTAIYSVYSPSAVYPGSSTQKGFLTGVKSDKYYIDESLVNIDTGVNNIAKMNSGKQELKNCNPYAAENGKGSDYGWRFSMWGFRFFVGYVYDFDGTYITYTTQNLREDSEYLQNGIPNNAVSENGYVGVYITEAHKYDTTENKYKIDYTGSTPVISSLNSEDIKSFREYGNACSKVLIKSRDGYSQQLFVIED